MEFVINRNGIGQEQNEAQEQFINTLSDIESAVALLKAQVAAITSKDNSQDNAISNLSTSTASISASLTDLDTVVNSLREVFGSNFSIKNDPFVIRVVLICIQAWLGSAYIFLLSTGVLQSINEELYEAADIDGATSFKKLTKITVPLVLFQTAPLLVGQYTFSFNNFSIIALFNNGGPFDPSKYGNLAGSSDLLISYIFKLTMNSQYQAIGATITVIISVALMIIAYIGYRNTDAFKRG